MKTKKQTWVLILSVIAIILVNAALICSLFTSDSSQIDNKLYYLFVAGIALLLILSVIAIVFHNKLSCCNPRIEKLNMLIIKIGLIPLYLIGGFLILTLTFIPVFMGIGFASAIIGWLLMIMTGSVWAICYALSLKTDGRISKSIATILIITQFIFVFDVVAALVMFFLGRSKEKQKGL